MKLSTYVRESVPVIKIEGSIFATDRKEVLQALGKAADYSSPPCLILHYRVESIAIGLVQSIVSFYSHIKKQGGKMALVVDSDKVDGVLLRTSPLFIKFNKQEIFYSEDDAISAISGKAPFLKQAAEHPVSAKTAPPIALMASS